MTPALFGITHVEPPVPGPIVFPKKRSGPRASYDAADTNAGNSRHWANADGLSAKAANSPEVRRKLRERARLEFDNGGNCRGAIETIAHDRMGTVPRLQVSFPQPINYVHYWQENGGEATKSLIAKNRAAMAAARAIEQAFQKWAADPIVNLGEKLRIANESELRDGEVFFRFRMNNAVAQACQLDIEVIETEVCCTPDANQWKDPSHVDGIEFDKAGNPAFYHLLKQHPGDLTWMPNLDYERVHASEVIHWFRPSRAGQRRGTPRITPGLPLMAQIRGYASATLASARLIAQYAAVMETNAQPDAGPVVVAEYDEVPLEDGSMLTLPAGWKMNQVRAEQPTSTHKEFKETNLTEFGRGIHAPRNIVTGDSSSYNFSSAKLDLLIYQGAIKIDRARAKVQKLTRIARMWAEHAVLIANYLPAGLPPVETWAFDWRFDGFPSIDPVKDATANEIRLRTGETTYAEILAEQGKYWEEHFEQLARERQRARELGIEDLLWPDQTQASADRQNRLATQPDEQRRRPADDGSDETVLDEEEELALA